MIQKVFKYVILLLIIANSGIPFFSFQKTFIVVSFMLSLMLFVYYKKRLEKDFYFIILLFLGIEMMQDVIFGNLSLVMHISTLLKLSSAYFVVKILRVELLQFFVKIIVFFCLISWVFFLGEAFFKFRDFFIPAITNYFEPFEKLGSAYTYSPNVLLYTFNPNTTQFEYLFGYRNSGPFYEPGAFSIFLIIAFIFNLLLHRKISHYSNIVLIVTVITTFSTAGYASFFTVIVSNSLLNSNIRYRIPLLIISLFLMYYGYYNLTFMEQKIERNIELADVTTSSRFGSAKADFEYIKKRPISGYGKNIENIFGRSEYSFDLMHRNNGLTKLIVNYGILIFLIYMFRLHKSFASLCTLFEHNKLLSLFLFLSIIVLGFSQSIFNYPVFYLFLFIPTMLKPYNIALRRIQLGLS